MPRASVTFGLRLPDSGPFASPESIELVAREGEDLGFSTLWVHDKILWTREDHSRNVSSGAVEAIEEGQEPNFYESITTLAYLAGITKESSLGVAVLVPPPRHPLVLAKQIATLDRLSRGRLILGIGVGMRFSYGRALEAMRVPLKARGRLVDEYIKAMKSIWSQERSSFQGNYINFEGVEIYPKPHQVPHPPLWVGGSSEAAIRRAATLGQGWIPGYLTPGEVLRGLEMIENLRGGLEGFTIALNTFACIAEEGREAWRRARLTIAAKLKAFDRPELQRDLEERFLIGSPKELLRRLEGFERSGVKHFELLFIYHSIEQLLSMLRLFKREVMASYGL